MFFNRKVAGIAFAVLCGILGVTATVSTHMPRAVAASVTAAPAVSRVIHYSGQNPQSSQTNYVSRFERLKNGTFMRDILGALNTTGAYSNLTITSGSGLNVTINPTNASQLGAVYQLGADDTMALPTSVPNIPADPTQIVLMGTQAANTAALGPLTAPGSNSMYYLIEAQLSQVDANNQSILFINSNGTTQFNSVNTYRSDVITYQTVAGAPAASPTPPPVDSGWVSIGNVHITSGQSQVHSGDITMNPNTLFGGLVAGVSPIVVTGPNVSCPTCVTTAGGQSIAGTTTMGTAAVTSAVSVAGAGSTYKLSSQNGGGGTCWTGFQSLVFRDDTNSANLMAIGGANGSTNNALNLSLCGDSTHNIPPAIASSSWQVNPWIWVTDPLRGGPQAGVTLTPMAVCDTTGSGPFVEIMATGEQVACGEHNTGSISGCGTPNTWCQVDTISFSGTPGAFTNTSYSCTVSPHGSGAVLALETRNRQVGSVDIWAWGPASLNGQNIDIDYHCVE